MRKTLELAPPDTERLARLCGAQDGHLRVIEESLGVRVHNRGHHFQVSGPEADAAAAAADVAEGKSAVLKSKAPSLQCFRWEQSALSGTLYPRCVEKYPNGCVFPESAFFSRNGRAHIKRNKNKIARPSSCTIFSEKYSITIFFWKKNFQWQRLTWIMLMGYRLCGFSIRDYIKNTYK